LPGTHAVCCIYESLKRVRKVKDDAHEEKHHNQRNNANEEQDNILNPSLYIKDIFNGSRNQDMSLICGLTNVRLREGRAEALPAEDAAFDVVLASLSLMYMLDRAAAAREIARVLRPQGRLVATVWAGPEQCDIVLFQQTAGRFAGPPPVPGVGPGALADPTLFLQQLAAVGMEARVEQETLGFAFDTFAAAWEALAGVTTAHLTPERQQEAKEAVMATMYPQGDGPRHFRNTTQFILGRVG
jgi:SAM-dependent methyltransferase